MQNRNKWASFRTRLLWTLVLLFGFFLILGAGHFYCSILVIVLMMISFNEIVCLKRDKEKERNLPMFRAQRLDDLADRKWFQILLACSDYFRIPVCLFAASS